MTGISQREFARLDGCDEALVRRKIRQGALKPLPDGTLDPALVGTDWRKTNRKPKLSIDDGEILDDDLPEPHSGDIDPEDAPETVSARAARLVDADGFEMLSIHDAETKKQNYLAARQKLLYDRECGKVVDIQDQAQIVADQLSRVRALLLTIPSKAAAAVIGCDDVQAAKTIIHREIVKVLTEITCDEPNL